MSNRVTLSARDLSLLRLLSWTPLSTSLLFRARDTFDGEPFLDERRLRERLQALALAAFVRSWSTAHAGGGLEKYYKLTLMGFECLYGTEVPKPPRAFFAEVSPSLFEHTFRLATVIVAIVRACHESGIAIDRFIRENELTLTAGEAQVKPDGFFRLRQSGRTFNLALEIDNSTESLQSPAANSVRAKLATYHAYQQHVLAQWLSSGKSWERPRFRVAFLTRSVVRAYHILAHAAGTALDRARRLVYAAPYDTFVSERDPLGSPLFLDHFGGWQSLVNLHPSAAFLRAPVKLPTLLEDRYAF